MIATIGITVGIAATICSGIYFGAKHLQALAVDRYRLGQLETNMPQLYSKVADIRSEMMDIKSDLTAIKSFLVQKYPENSYILTIKKSPRTLNELGAKIFEQVKGVEFLNKNKDFFFSLIDRFNPKTALDVENATNYVCSAYTDNDIFNGIKLYVYKAPSLVVKNKKGEEMTYDLTLVDVCYVLSIPLRDMYLQEHPEILQ